MKGATADKVSDLLETAQRLTEAHLVRQLTLIEVYLALDSLAEGCFQQATEVALSALEKSWQIRSRLMRDRIFGVYQQLLSTSFRDKPMVSYLGMKLRTWERGME